MSIRLSSHLHQNRYGVFGFRIVIPRDLRLSFQRREIRISLRTTSRTAAKPLALRLTLLTTDYFSKMRRAPSIDEALATGKELLRALSSGSFDDLTIELKSLIDQAEGDTKDNLRKLISLRDRYNANKDARLACLKVTIDQLPGKSDAEIDTLFCDMYADVTPLVIEGKVMEAELHNLTLDAQRGLQNIVHEQDLQQLQEAQQAEISNITDLAAEIAAKTAQRVASAISSTNPTPYHPKLNSEPLGVIVQAYCTNQINEGSWTAKTEAENRAIFALWVRIVGDQPIKGYGFEQHRDYKAKLQRLPSNLNKSPRYRGKGIDEVLAMSDRPAAPNTINKNLTRVSALFEWAIKYGYATLNPARGMTIANPKRANEERQAFTDDDLGKLFGSPEYLERQHKHPYQYWVPLIALYTGARLNEICQLHLCDLDESDGIKILRITADGGSKRLKTKAARRAIPLHPELLRLGLLDHADSLRLQRHDRLFPELKEGRDGYGRAASKWFAGYASRCGVNAPGKVFHSFRHTFIDRLKQAEVPKEKIAALVGHEDDSVTFGRYGKDFKATLLAAVVNSIYFDTSKVCMTYSQRSSSAL